MHCLPTILYLCYDSRISTGRSVDTVTYHFVVWECHCFQSIRTIVYYTVCASSSILSLLPSKSFPCYILHQHTTVLSNKTVSSILITISTVAIRMCTSSTTLPTPPRYCIDSCITCILCSIHYGIAPSHYSPPQEVKHDAIFFL